MALDAFLTSSYYNMSGRCSTLGTVISIRVPEELKREMDRLRDKVNWSEEIREFIKRRIEEYRKKEIINELVEYIKTLPEAPKEVAQELVRESRDSC